MNACWYKGKPGVYVHVVVEVCEPGVCLFAGTNVSQEYVHIKVNCLYVNHMYRCYVCAQVQV